MTAAVAGLPFDALRQQAQASASDSRSSGYGPLAPVLDQATGLPLLRLPEGFRYWSFGWTGDLMANGAKTPDYHDGMAVVAQEGNVVTLIRNHEVFLPGPSMASAEETYDPKAGGGCTRLRFDVAQEKFLSTEPAIGGTHRNCAGGPTPWGSWLTCEETVDDAHGEFDGKPLPFEKDHGFIFEVPATGLAKPAPLKEMGRFTHEAVAVDPATSIVYETEDNGTAGFYRFLPRVAGKLAEGGKLQMMKIAGWADTRANMPANKMFDVAWVDIEDPLRAHSKGVKDRGGVYSQGKEQGASTFARLEGCWYGKGKIYFVSTSGGKAGFGQIFEYDPKNEAIRLVFESPNKSVLDYPDNIAVSPRGGLILCEDGDRKIERLCSLSLDGQLSVFAENNVRLQGERNGFKGDFTRQEWCGATFTGDGKWLFANIQTPGITFAITGPWESGPL
jgi:secreted PhoX family phosphatase